LFYIFQEILNSFEFYVGNATDLKSSISTIRYKFQN
jgi:hypothetical protein